MSTISGEPELDDWVPAWDPLPLDDEQPEIITPASTVKREEQDHEFRGMRTTPLMLEQAASYFEAQGSAGNATATDRGAAGNPLCAAVAKCSMNSVPLKGAPQASSQTSQGDEVGEEVQTLVSGIRKNSDGTVVLEPLWYQARSLIWLLNVRKHIQDDASFLKSRGQH